MIQITAQMRVLVAIEPVDGRKGIDSLARLCQDQLAEDPFSGCVFVFRSRSGTAIRLLSYDGQGYWLAQKRLSKGRFVWWPEANGRTKPLETYEAQLLLAAGDVIRQAAQGEVVHNDDTGMKVLKLEREPGDERTGVFTTGIVSTGQGWKIALYFTGRQHAGENIADVLKQRAAELPAPIQMCDACRGMCRSWLREWRFCWLTAWPMEEDSSWKLRRIFPPSAATCWRCWARCMAAMPKRASAGCRRTSGCGFIANVAVR
jgi:transposase